jgi:hypothetical protein
MIASASAGTPGFPGAGSAERVIGVPRCTRAPGPGRPENCSASTLETIPGRLEAIVAGHKKRLRKLQK